MKLSELRQLIREEIVTVINEVTISASDKANYSPKFIKDVERLYFIENRARQMLYNSRSMDQLWSRPSMHKINDEWDKLEVRRVINEAAVKAIYIDPSDDTKAEDILSKNKFSVFKDTGGSKGDKYAVEAPRGWGVYTKSLNDEGGKHWEKFIKLVKASKLKHKEVK